MLRCPCQFTVKGFARIPMTSGESKERRSKQSEKIPRESLHSEKEVSTRSTLTHSPQPLLKPDAFSSVQNSLLLCINFPNLSTQYPNSPRHFVAKMNGDEYSLNNQKEIIQDFYQLPLTLTDKITTIASSLQQACAPILLAIGELVLSFLLLLVLSVNIMIMTGLCKVIGAFCDCYARRRRRRNESARAKWMQKERSSSAIRGTIINEGTAVHLITKTPKRITSTDP